MIFSLDIERRCGRLAVPIVRLFSATVTGVIIAKWAVAQRWALAVRARRRAPLAHAVICLVRAAAVPLDDDGSATIREGLEQARRGEFVRDGEIEALWTRFGL